MIFSCFRWNVVFYSSFSLFVIRNQIVLICLFRRDVKTIFFRFKSKKWNMNWWESSAMKVANQIEAANSGRFMCVVHNYFSQSAQSYAHIAYRLTLYIKHQLNTLSRYALISRMENKIGLSVDQCHVLTAHISILFINFMSCVIILNSPVSRIFFFRNYDFPCQQRINRNSQFLFCSTECGRW